MVNLEEVKRKIRIVQLNLWVFFKWIIISIITGVVGGAVGSIFHLSVELATKTRIEHSWILYLLPFGGLLIVFMYKKGMKGDPGTNLVINSIRTDGKVPFLMAPLIFLGTVITHLFGGSAGREGAALQLGGSIGSQIGNLIGLDEKDMHLITLCGMSSVFSALFGTPLTATFFAMEVISIGIIHYSAFIPCIVSSVTAYYISIYFGLDPVRFNLNVIPEISLINIVKVMILGSLCAVVSIIFCNLLHKSNNISKKIISNAYVRVFIGGIIIVLLTIIIGTRDYNGAGMDVILNAMNGTAKPEAFLLKMIFTAITISVGYKGGEIVPTFFIGATFGCVVGKFLGLDPCFGAAVGLVALFCGVVNTLITSIILSIELFGAGNIVLFAIACGVSYMESGYYSLYSSQKIMYSKIKAEYINRNAK
ncbi:chloride channel protein [Clostridium butyricum]|jgi:H+/Cl- antiporter ClcA|uniref:Chloride channel protein n=1 Tax=Clostridium butyricum TaxID=1492 RepID=A0A2S7FDK7_CLOBU|nr:MULTISPECIES: chloride channel protein [Clostridium]ETI87425.1 MAG: Voltage-gated chloride channel [Clostridium butyricum DORA_1]KHD15617.1 chloride channel protein [Clostridium butyricum]MBS5982096.1 chloride channel protein [Clostridium butyricum]MBZ0311661.1 chloride channel protein [Clostridium butyricum]MDB2150936.1 chloride channel protein [Clostridium butyricum]